MSKDSLAVFTLMFSAIIGGLVLIGYGLHMFNTLQFLVGFITACVIGGACIDALFFAEDRYHATRTQYNLPSRKGE
jgi:hypothetical protein